MTVADSRTSGRFQALHTSEVEPVQQIKGGYRRVLADGENEMLVEWRFEPGASVPEHHHPHEQCGYVISGTMLFTIEGVEREVPLGTGYIIPSNIPHSARFEEFTVLIDVFSPPREDYREQSENAPSYMMGTMPGAALPAHPERATPQAHTRKRKTPAGRKPRAAARASKPARSTRGTTRRR